MKPEKVAGWINNSKFAQNMLRKVNKNPAVFNAVASFGLAAVARPALMEVIPFKDKNDKKYSQASAVAAGLVELGGTAALFIPLNKAIQKASDNLFKATGTLYKDNPLACRQFKSVTNRGIKVLSLIPLSLLRFSIVKPIVNLMFGGRHEGK